MVYSKVKIIWVGGRADGAWTALEELVPTHRASLPRAPAPYLRTSWLSL